MERGGGGDAILEASGKKPGGALHSVSGRVMEGKEERPGPHLSGHAPTCPPLLSPRPSASCKLAGCSNCSEKMTAKPSPGRSGWRRALGGGSLLSTHVPLFGPATCSVCTAACGTMGGNGTSPESSRNSQERREAVGPGQGEAQGRDTQAGPPGGELSTAEGPRQRFLPQTGCMCPLPGKAFCFGKAAPQSGSSFPRH